MHPNLILALGLVLVLCSSSSNVAAESAAANVRLTAIALTGELAPGTERTFVYFGTTIVNSTGEVAFDAALSIDEAGGFDTVGIWGPTRGLDLGLVALQGGLTPSGSGERFSSLSVPFLGDEGRLAFVASLVDAEGFGLGSGIWAQLDGNKLVSVAQEGAAAPGTESEYGTLAAPIIEGSGRVIFRGSVRVTSGRPFERNGGLWATTASGLDLLAREGDPAVGASADFDDPLGPLALSSSGESYFDAGLNPDGRRIATDRGLYRADSNGEPALLLRTGESLPGLRADEILVGFQGTQFNDRGDFTTVGVVSTEVGRELGVFVAPKGMALRALAREGEPAPGAPEGTVFDDFYSVAMDATGRVAFFGNAGGFRGIFGPDGFGGITAYLLTTDSAPGLPADVTISSVGGLTMNDDGELIFLVGLRDPEYSTPNDAAIYFASDDIDLVPVIVTGSVLEVRPGDFRTVASIELVTRSRAAFSPLGARGQLTFVARFDDDSSGVFLAEVSPPLDVEIDILPNRRKNSVRPGSRERIPVAILGSEIFDVADVDVTTLALGPEAAPPARRPDTRYTDVDRDGFVDLVSRFVVRETGVVVGDKITCLAGSTLDGIAFTACDAITTYSRYGFSRRKVHHARCDVGPSGRFQPGLGKATGRLRAEETQGAGHLCGNVPRQFERPAPGLSPVGLRKRHLVELADEPRASFQGWLNDSRYFDTQP